MRRRITNGIQGELRAFSDAAKARPKMNRSRPAQKRVTQDQVEQWKRQRSESLALILFRDADARELDLSRFAWRWEDFRNCDLRGAKLSGCDFTGANFEGADLRNADLSGGNLRGVDLSGCNFTGANFEGADLWNADLSGSDLTGVGKLLPKQLAVTKLEAAKLPDSLTKFEALEASEKLADNASKVFLTILGAVVFTFLTIATTKDAQLLTNSGNTKLPVISTDMPILGFYCAIPIILLALFIYFHLYLQRLWEALVTLPSVFPDGRRLDEKSHPWLLTDLVRRHLPRLQTELVALSRLQSTVSVVLGYWVVPITLAALWLRLFPLHNWPIIAFHLIMLTSGVGFACYFVGNRQKTFKDESLKIYPIYGVVGHFLSAGRGIPAGVAAGLIGLCLSPVLFRSVHANLSHANLHGAYLYRACLYGADIRRADLQHANLQYAELQHATLQGANLQYADLQSATLQHAHLQDADLQNAYLWDAQLQNADLRGAKLQGAKLQGANLEGATVSDLNDLKNVVGTFEGNVTVEKGARRVYGLPDAGCHR